MSKLLAQTPGVAPVLVKDGWPTKKETLDGSSFLIVKGNQVMEGWNQMNLGELMQKLQVK